MSTTASSPQPCSAPDGAGSYRQLLALPGAARFFLAASTGRVGAAATGLGLVWLVTQARGSFAAAGSVVGALAVAEAVVGPQVARLVDRWGQTRVLPWVLGAHALAGALTVAAVLAGAPAPVLVLAGAVVGASTPQLGALSSARWVALLAERRDWLPRAFALESLANAVAFLVGPVLVSAVATSGRAWAGTTGAAALVVGGGLALVAQRRTAPPVDPGATSGPGRVRPAGQTSTTGLRSGRFVVLVALSGLLGVHFGGVTLSVTAWSQERGSAAVATALFAVSSGAGLAGAWAYGLRRWRAAPVAQLSWAAGGMVLGCTAMAVATAGPPGAAAAARTVGLGTALAVTAVVVPVVVVQLAVLVEAGLGRGVLTQALTWASSASAAGSAAAGALAGGVIDATGARGGFALLTGVSTCLLLLALAARRRLR